MKGYDPNHVEAESEQVQMQTMVLYKYFKPLDGLPDPSVSVSPVVIQDTNEAVRSVTHRSKPIERYAKFTLKQQAAISEYASLRSKQAW